MDDFKLYLSACSDCLAKGTIAGELCVSCGGQRVSIVGEDDDHDIVLEIEMAAEEDVN